MIIRVNIAVTVFVTFAVISAKSMLASHIVHNVNMTINAIRNLVSFIFLLF